MLGFGILCFGIFVLLCVLYKTLVLLSLTAEDLRSQHQIEEFLLNFIDLKVLKMKATVTVSTFY